MRRSLLVLGLAACTPPSDETASEASAAASTESPADSSTINIPTTGTTTSDASSAGTDAPPAGCLAGDVVLASNDEVLALAGCTDIEGDLEIAGTVTDLTPLASLRRVAGTLAIDGPFMPQLTSLAGLEGLESVGALDLEDLAVPDLKPLAGLTDVPGGVSLVNFRQPFSLEGLHNLEHIGGRLSIQICKQLTDLEGLRGLKSIGGDLHFYYLSQLTSLHGLESLTVVGAADGPPVKIVLSNLPLVTSLASLAIAWHNAHYVRISHTGITDLVGLTGASQLNGLIIADNYALPSLAGLEALTDVSDSLILGGLDLGDITALANLQSVGVLMLGQTPAITDLEPLTSLAHVDQLRIGPTVLTDLGPLPALTQLRAVYLGQNPQLTALSGLAGFTSLGTLSLEQNPLLTDLTDLADLTTLTESLYIVENDALTTLATLASLTQVDDSLVVIHNPALPQQDAVAWAAPITVGGGRKVAVNKGYGPPADPCPWLDDATCDEPDDAHPLAICAASTDWPDCSPGD